jgi:hypothetical protein
MPPFQLSFLNLIFGPRPKKKQRITVRSRESDAALKELWISLRLEYFPNQAELDNYLIVWSRRRQKRVLACCHIQRQEVRVATELKFQEHFEWLSPLLYHEMCHAALGASIPKRNGKRPWHGRDFKALVARHPRTHALETWIREGGWSKAVRSARAKNAYRKRAAA